MTDRWYRFASTAQSVASARRAGKLVPVSDALIGDILVHLYDSSTGHTGMLSQPLRHNGRANTIDGNTSGGDDRDGGSVQERDRPQSFWQYCIRMDWTPEERAAAVALARSQIGETEHPFGSNCQKFGAWYKFNCVAWCAEFLSWVVALFPAPATPPPPPPPPPPTPPEETAMPAPGLAIDHQNRQWFFIKNKADGHLMGKRGDESWVDYGGLLTAGPAAEASLDRKEIVVVVRGVDGDRHPQYKLVIGADSKAIVNGWTSLGGDS